MGQYQDYAGADLTDIRRVAKQLVIAAGGRAENVTAADAQKFSREADVIINTALSPVYLTPLRQITRGGETFYPHPIQYLAIRIAASLMVQSVYSESEANTTENARRFGEQAILELQALSQGTLRGHSTLEGQTALAKNNFANPRVAPRENPPTPRQFL